MVKWAKLERPVIEKTLYHLAAENQVRGTQLRGRTGDVECVVYVGASRVHADHSRETLRSAEASYVYGPKPALYCHRLWTGRVASPVVCYDAVLARYRPLKRVSVVEVLRTNVEWKHATVYEYEGSSYLAEQ
ncbi:hypothetical protein N7489_006162 [Penicillium chrysogenum]|uniref:uncharacterized protein n=1 Tax=Penicillium chrysogenum TaxID=5076 RepID=UPI0024DF2560|nr:uncharacterized protein N7489_006162 [Penicillium chrysogenum]KAJ5236071.1 hypothetical protein N7489_006162 [Penicillium chrysogenum]